VRRAPPPSAPRAEAHGPRAGPAILDAVPADAAAGHPSCRAERAQLDARLGTGDGDVPGRAMALSADEAVRARLAELGGGARG